MREQPWLEPSAFALIVGEVLVDGGPQGLTLDGSWEVISSLPPKGFGTRCEYGEGRQGAPGSSPAAQPEKQVRNGCSSTESQKKSVKRKRCLLPVCQTP